MGNKIGGEFTGNNNSTNINTLTPQKPKSNFSFFSSAIGKNKSKSSSKEGLYADTRLFPNFESNHILFNFKIRLYMDIV